MSAAYAADDIICGDQFLQLSRRHANVSYIKTDAFRRDGQVQFRDSMCVVEPNQVWISGHSDHCIDQQVYDAYSPLCKTWYATNKSVSAANLVGIPLGITNDCADSAVHPVLGNKAQMLEVMKIPKRCYYMVYMNINVSTYPAERTNVHELFKGKRWVKTDECVYEPTARLRFLKTIRNSMFVLCPRGYGIDTHRLWETLYMGSIPIVIRDPVFDEFHDLPILFIDEWTELTETFLRTEYTRIVNATWNLEKLKFGYWEQLIVNRCA
jgi:hypothetical protein